MKVLLTGSSGFLGNNILRTLLAEGHQVKVLQRHSSDPRPTEGLSVEKVYADLANLQDVGQIVTDIDVLIHAAAVIKIGWSQLEQSLKVNVNATKLLAEAARRKNVRMVHISTVDTLASCQRDQVCDESSVTPRKPQCTYVVSKSRAEQAFMEEVSNGLDGLIISPGFMVGPWDWKPSSGEMMLTIAKQFVPFAPAGGFSVADVRDVAEGVLSSITHGRTGEKYILGGENMTYLDLWTRISEVVGKSPPKFPLPNWLARVAGTVGDIVGKCTKSEPHVNSAGTKMGQLFHYYTSAKAEEELGYRIGSVDVALADAWDWFKSYDYV